MTGNGETMRIPMPELARRFGLTTKSMLDMLRQNPANEEDLSRDYAGTVNLCCPLCGERSSVSTPTNGRRASTQLKKEGWRKYDKLDSWCCVQCVKKFDEGEWKYDPDLIRQTWATLWGDNTRNAS